VRDVAGLDGSRDAAIQSDPQIIKHNLVNDKRPALGIFAVGLSAAVFVCRGRDLRRGRGVVGLFDELLQVYVVTNNQSAHRRGQRGRKLQFVLGPFLHDESRL
jgi:hypothetical protein